MRAVYRHHAVAALPSRARTARAAPRRIAPVAANGIATINRLAPGRCFVGLGTGRTAMRPRGRKPMRLAPFRAYVQVVRAVLRGEEVDYALEGGSPTG
jgi:alkanesulfonate monooxygenase SsuD/methylene tetrahydromethanopterin reductase-like flavin-dependent oxidoreductase (luciferase family)